MELVTIGVDIGQRRDPTAIVVAEATRSLIPTGPVGWQTEFDVRHLERLPLGTSYPDVADRVGEIVRNLWRRPAPNGRRVWLVLDSTGVGNPVVELVRQRVTSNTAAITGATFIHGERLNGTIGDKEIRVGKSFLVSRMQALFQTRRIRLPVDHREAQAMLKELQEYEIRIDAATSADTYGAFKTGAHDDLVTALGLATIDDPVRAIDRKVIRGR